MSRRVCLCGMIWVLFHPGAGAAGSSNTLLLYYNSWDSSPSFALVKVIAEIKDLRQTRIFSVQEGQMDFSGQCLCQKRLWTQQKQRTLQRRTRAHVWEAAHAHMSFGAPVGHIRDRVPLKWVSRCHKGDLLARCSLRRLGPAEGFRLPSRSSLLVRAVAEEANPFKAAASPRFLSRGNFAGSGSERLSQLAGALLLLAPR